MLELTVQEHLESRAKSKGCKVYRLILPGRKGWPDTLVITPRGVHGWVETKRPKGGKVSPHQRAIEKELTGNNAIHRYVKALEEAENFVDELLNFEGNIDD